MLAIGLSVVLAVVEAAASDSFIGNNCVIMAKQEIPIGDGAAIAEQVSIRNHDHVMGQRPLTGGLDVAPVHVGEQGDRDPRSDVGNGAVVAAGAVVTRRWWRGRSSRECLQG